MTSYRAMDWTLLDHAAQAPVKVGDVVSADAGGMPTYRIMAFEGGAAWVAGDHGAPVRLLSLDRFRWRGTDSKA